MSNTPVERLEAMLAAGQELSTFAFEFRRTYGRLMPAGCSRYDELAQVSGMGIVRRTLFASMMSPAAETGVWQARVSDPAALRTLAQAIVDAKLADAPPYHVEPGGLMLWVRVAAGDSRFETYLFSGDKRSHIELLAPVRSALAPLLNEAANQPVRTLGLDLEMPVRLPRGKVRAPLQLTFRNSGAQAHWVRNPYSPLNGTGDVNDIRRLIYRMVPPAASAGPTPLPPTTLYASLEVAPENRPAPGEELHVLIEPGGFRTFEFTASLDLSKPGRHLFEAEFGAFASSEALDGFPRWAGCAGSNRAELNIS